MIRIAALIVRDSSPLRFAGLDLAERAERVVRRAGIDRVHVVDDDRPFAHAPSAELLLVVPERVIVESDMITDLVLRGVHGPEEAAVVMAENGLATGIMLLSSKATERVRAAPRLHSGLRRLRVEAIVRLVRVPPRFIARIRDARDIARIETAYLRHISGAGRENVLARNIRSFSIPLSRWLLAFGISANQVTLCGCALAVLAGLSLSIGTYSAGLAGAAFYCASVVLGRSGGEVARASVSDSKFGAFAMWEPAVSR
jgi:hypothetical protein